MMQQPPPLPPVNPYAAPTARVSDVAVDEHQLELADRGTRLGAVIVDGLLFGLASMVMVFGFLGGARGFSALGGRNVGSEPSTVGLITGCIAAIALIALTVINFVWLYQTGQSVAKRWLKIRIVRSDGSRCGLTRVIFLRVLPLAFVAGLLNLLPPLGLLLRLADPLLIFRSDYRCIHDHIADTIVVKA